MSEFLKVLLNIRSLRAAMRELSLEQVKEAHEKIEAIYLERLELAEKEQAANAEHQQKLAEFQAMLAQAGIDPTELVGCAQQQRLRLKRNEHLGPRNTVMLKMA